MPASVYGFCVTGTGILFSSVVGALIDRYDRLRTVRLATIIQKFGSGGIYALFLFYFLEPEGHNGLLSGPRLGAFIGMLILGGFMKLATVCLTISIERDWASTIGGGSSTRLTKINAWLRRVVRIPFL